MRRSKVHAASVRLDVPLYMRVEKIAKADCRRWPSSCAKSSLILSSKPRPTNQPASIERRRRDAAYSGVTGQFPRPFH